MVELTDTLKERGSRYGAFINQARIASNIRNAFADSNNWHVLDDDQVEALLLIANKLSRILNGDPHYSDSWHDIAGYAKLIADRLEIVEVVEPEPNFYEEEGNYEVVITPSVVIDDE